MAYDGEIGNLRFQAGHVMYQLTTNLLAKSQEAAVNLWDDAELLMDVISSFYTEQDPEFEKEWKQIQEDRAREVANGYEPGTQWPNMDVRFRYRELKAQFRSLCRMGVFVYLEPEPTEWKG